MAVSADIKFDTENALMKINKIDDVETNINTEKWPKQLTVEEYLKRPNLR